jgi:polysaccharide biosynthesis protein PslH
MRRLKILFLSQIVPYPPHGGVLQRGYNIIKELARSNDISLLAFIHPEMLPSPELIEESRERLQSYCVALEYFSLWPKKSSLHKLAAYGAAFFDPKPFSTLAHRSSSLAKRMTDLLSSEQIDLVHFDTIGLAPYLPLAQGLPAVLTHHNIESELMARRARAEKTLLGRFYVGLQARRLRRYEKRMSPRFATNIMVSAHDETSLLALAPAATTVVAPNGVDTAYFSVREEPQEPSIIYTGGMNMFANKDAVLHFIADIWPLVKQKVPGVVFHVIGQDPPSDLLHIAQRDGSVRVHGYVDDVRPYVARAAVYAVPIRVGGGTRLKVLDAMAQGKAIVSTSVGCEGIEVVHGEQIYIEDEDRAFAERVATLLGDQGLRHELGRRARLVAEAKYSWTIIGSVLQNAYQSLVENHADGRL